MSPFVGRTHLYCSAKLQVKLAYTAAPADLAVLSGQDDPPPSAALWVVLDTDVRVLTS